MAETDAGKRAPGWYTDPAGGGGLAYWDGSRWTGEHRPRPSWQRPDPAAEAAEEREARRRWAHGRRSWLLMAGVVVLVAGLAWITLPKPDNPGPRVVTDTGFVAAASRECTSTINNLRPPLGPDDAKSPTPAELAGDVDRVADGLSGLAGRLRALPLAPADQGHISDWLAGWDQYTSIGHRYAAALRSNDHKAQAQLSKDGDQVQKRTDRFARANGLKTCQFYITPRGTGSDPFSGGS